jgi:hypothetical protein
MKTNSQSSWSKGISKMKSKQQSPCSNCMHRPVMSQADAAPHRLMHACNAPLCHRQLLHGLCCFDFVSDIPLSPATLQIALKINNELYIFKN